MIGMLDIERFAWLRPMPVSVMVAAFAAVVILTVFLYRRGWGLPLWVRITLAFFRLVVLGLVVAALFEPTVTVKQTRNQPRHLQVLIDVSESMAVKDQRVRSEDLVEAAAVLDMIPFSEAKDTNRAFMSLDAQKRRTIAATSRLDLAKSIVSKSARPMFESLGNDLDVSYHAFGKSLHMLGSDKNATTDSLAALKANETGTFIAESLEAAAKVNRGSPLAGIVLLTDGLDTSSRQGEAMIMDLGRRGIPVYPVPIGVVSPDDVSIRNVMMQEVAFPGDKVPVRVQIQSKGYEKRSTELTVLLNGRNVAQKSVSLKGGLQFADRITTVSPSYAEEIQSEPMGMGLQGLLAQRKGVLTGILNGIDTDAWDPESDPYIERYYSASRLAAKQDNKRALQLRMGLRDAPETPLFGAVGRLTDQKGLDVLADIADDLVKLPAQLVILGSGDPVLQQRFQELAQRYAGEIAVQIGFDESLSHQIEAGADLFAMPSRFEPCGLNQMYSQRYGTPPLVHGTGGLRDSVVDCTPETLKNHTATGFAFTPLDSATLLENCRRAVTAYHDKRIWRQVQKNGMQRDFSWEARAQQYLGLYRGLPVA